MGLLPATVSQTMIGRCHDKVSFLYPFVESLLIEFNVLKQMMSIKSSITRVELVVMQHTTDLLNSAIHSDHV
jgi:hypothetical protein